VPATGFHDNKGVMDGQSKACMKTVLSQPKPPDIEHLSLVDGC